MAKKRKKKENRFDKFFLLTWKKIFIGIIAWFIAVIIHNLIYAFFMGVLNIDFDEPFFFIIAIFVIPLYFLISIVYTLIKLVKRKR